MSTLAEIRAALERLRRTHLVVDDCWYSCPAGRNEWGASECCDDDRAKGDCDCGADRENAILDGLLAALPADGVIVTPDSLARALHKVDDYGPGSFMPWPDPAMHAVAILAALAAEGGPA